MISALEYFKEQQRMCDTVPCCNKCPFNELANELEFDDCRNLQIKDPERAIAAVEQWSIFNPIVTRADKFEEVFGFNPIYRIWDDSREFHEAVKSELRYCDWWTQEFEEKL